MSRPNNTIDTDDQLMAAARHIVTLLDEPAETLTHWDLPECDVDPDQVEERIAS